MSIYPVIVLYLFLFFYCSDAVRADSSPGSVSAASSAPAQVVSRRQLRALPGELNKTPVYYSNSPEVVLEEGILLSGFSKRSSLYPEAHLDVQTKGPFGIFYHHIANGEKSGQLNDLMIGVLFGNEGARPIDLRIKRCKTYLSQPDAPFIPLPQLTSERVYAGPGDRVSLELLEDNPSADLSHIRIEPGQTVLWREDAIPVSGLAPPLNGRNFLAYLESSGPVSIAIVSRFAEKNISSDEALKKYKSLLSGKLVGPRETPPTAPGSSEPLRYGRVSGISSGTQWTAGSKSIDRDCTVLLNPDTAPVSFVLSALAGGSFGTHQIQSAPLLARYPDTAYSSHGNYGVLYDLRLNLVNEDIRAVNAEISLECPLKADSAKNNEEVVFLEPPAAQVFFRGSLRLDEPHESEARIYHYVLHRGEKGEPFYCRRMEPGEKRTISISFYYPADCTPPQLLTVKSSSMP